MSIRTFAADIDAAITDLDAGMKAHKRRLRSRKASAPTKPNIADWIEKYCKIRPKEGGLIPLQLNRFQRRLVEYVQKRWEENRAVRIVIDKSRQLGLSTVIQAMAMFFLVVQNNWNILTLAHVEGSALEIFEMQQRYWEHLPAEDNGRPLKPVLKGGKKESKQHLTFVAPWSNKSKVLTAGGSDVRGTTYQMIHASEMAFYQDADKAMTAMSQSIHEEVFSLFFVESTANGLGTFKHYWDLAADENSGWVRFFFSWIEDPDCVLTPPKGFELSPDELDYREQVKEATGIFLTDAQLNWFRRKREDKCQGKWEDAHREYPATAELSFMSTASYVFNQMLIAKELEEAA